MSTIIGRYAALAVPGVNLVKNLKPDESGYYKAVLGGFNLCNHSGIYYPLTDSVKALFGEGGVVKRRLDSGLCRAELGHPDLNGMSLDNALKRLAFIDPMRVCAHIKSVELVEHKDEFGKPIVLAVGWVKPSGPYADSVQKQLDNPEENVTWSVRSFTQSSMHGDKLARIIVDIQTWDYVTEPGIKWANKFTTATLEHINPEITFNQQDMERAIKLAKGPLGTSMENDYSSLVMVKTQLGWNKVQTINLSALDWK